MHLPDGINAFIGWAAYEFTRLQPFLPTYAHLIASALFPIYTGSYASLSRPSSAAKPKKKDKDGKATDSDDEDEPDQRMEGLSPTDAILFPVLAGCTLSGLYFLIKWLEDPALLNKLLNWYFATFSVFSVSRLVSDGLDVLHSVLFPHDYVDRGVLFHVDAKTRHAIPTTPGAEALRSSPLPSIFSRVQLPERVRDFLWMLHVIPSHKFTFKAFVRRFLHVKLKLGIHGIEGLCVGLATVLYYNFVSKPWYLTNLMGFGFAYGALQLLSPTTFSTGTLILGALFFYDVYFVFFTPMMVTVAKSLDIPIKLLFPRPADPESDSAIQALSMLGLGDVVLPGIMIGLALRFDLFMFYVAKQTRIPSDAVPVKDAYAGKSNHTPQLTDNQESLTPEVDTPTSSASTDTDSQPSANDTTTTIIQKAPYHPVSEGWGDRLWTSRLLSGLLNILLFSGPQSASAISYTARNSFPKPYFHASLFGYVTGMLVTLGAMQITKHAQPALLYLVPGVVGSIWIKAWLRGELKEIWTFSDAGENDSKDKKKPDEKAKDAEKKEAEAVEKKQNSSRKSIFSTDKSDDRAHRVDNALSQYVQTGGDTDSDPDDTEGGDEVGSKRKGNHKKRRRAREDCTIFAFSITAPLLARHEHHNSSPSDRRKSSGSEVLAVAAAEATRKWRASSEKPEIGKGEQPSGKRQRVE